MKQQQTQENGKLRTKDNDRQSREPDEAAVVTTQPITNGSQGYNTIQYN